MFIENCNNDNINKNMRLEPNMFRIVIWYKLI